MLEAKAKVDKIVEFLESKKARDISVINIENISTLADYFVVCNGTSSTHIKALADELEFRQSELDVPYMHMEGYSSARWILLDYGEVVVHLFQEEDRDFYNLERLWSDGIMTHIR